MKYLWTFAWVFCHCSVILVGNTIGNSLLLIHCDAVIGEERQQREDDMGLGYVLKVEVGCLFTLLLRRCCVGDCIRASEQRCWQRWWEMLRDAKARDASKRCCSVAWGQDHTIRGWWEHKSQVMTVWPQIFYAGNAWHSDRMLECWEYQPLHISSIFAASSQLTWHWCA